MENSDSFTSVKPFPKMTRLHTIEDINNSIMRFFQTNPNALLGNTSSITHQVLEKCCLEILEEILYYVTEEHGRELVHLLPEIFQELEDEGVIPDVLETGVKETIEMLAEMLGCTKYETSFFEFWFLDMVADGLIKAQKQKMTQGDLKPKILYLKLVLLSEAARTLER